ncbi:hypothetical protein EXIGLDRAFT_733163, partial [Exidia glandulosa HHB12029]
MAGTVANAARVASRTVKAPPLTHFLAIPLGHLPGLRERVSSFTDGLLSTDPPLSGMDASIVILPRRLHMTLGVLSLVKEDKDIKHPTQTTISRALAILERLKPRLHEVATSMVVPLVSMDIMRPLKGKASPHVLYVGPNEEDVKGTSLERISNMVHDAFRAEGLFFEDRPLKLHCTLINTVYRKPRARKRVPFSYNHIKGSKALADILAGQVADGKPLRVDLGTWEVDEIQLCEMGSHDPEGAYVRVGGISLK